MRVYVCMRVWRMALLGMPWGHGVCACVAVREAHHSATGQSLLTRKRTDAVVICWVTAPGSGVDTPAPVLTRKIGIESDLRRTPLKRGG